MTLADVLEQEVEVTLDQVWQDAMNEAVQAPTITEANVSETLPPGNAQTLPNPRSTANGEQGYAIH